MLVVSRKAGESIVVSIGGCGIAGDAVRANGEVVRVTFVTMRGHRARIGIEAPEHCRILREEIDATKEAAK